MSFDLDRNAPHLEILAFEASNFVLLYEISFTPTPQNTESLYLRRRYPDSAFHGYSSLDSPYHDFFVFEASNNCLTLQKAGHIDALNNDSLPFGSSSISPPVR